MVFSGHSRNTIPVRSPFSAPLGRQMTLEIEVHLFSILRINRFATARVQVSAPARVNTIVEKLGPNHVLPTMGTARFASALGVETFLKKSSIISYSAAVKS